MSGEAAINNLNNPQVTSERDLRLEQLDRLEKLRVGPFTDLKTDEANGLRREIVAFEAARQSTLRDRIAQIGLVEKLHIALEAMGERMGEELAKYLYTDEGKKEAQMADSLAQDIGLLEKNGVHKIKEKVIGKMSNKYSEELQSGAYRMAESGYLVKKLLEIPSWKEYCKKSLGGRPPEPEELLNITMNADRLLRGVKLARNYQKVTSSQDGYGRPLIDEIPTPETLERGYHYGGNWVGKREVQERLAPGFEKAWNRIAAGEKKNS